MSEILAWGSWGGGVSMGLGEGGWGDREGGCTNTECAETSAGVSACVAVSVTWR